jgi:hypothetical protein
VIVRFTPPQKPRAHLPGTVIAFVGLTGLRVEAPADVRHALEKALAFVQGHVVDEAVARKARRILIAAGELVPGSGPSH